MIKQFLHQGSSIAADRLEAAKPQSLYVRYFFAAMACNFILLTALGFIPDYMMFHSKPELIVHWFAHFHGAVMALWLLLFLVQTILAVRGNINYHRHLGQLAFGFGILVWVTMIIVTVRPKIAFPPPLADFTWDILLISLLGIILFAPFFSWSLLQRNNPQAHKRLMLLATIALMQATVDRLRFLPLISESFQVRFVYLDLFFLVPLLLYDLLSIRRIHRVTLIGAALLIGAQTFASNAAQTQWWHKTAIAMFAPFVDPVAEVKLNDAQMAQLVGNYGSKDWYVTVSYNNGKLYLKLPDVPIFEMIATSDSETSLLATAWHISFIRDKNGRVIKIINKQPEVIWTLNKMDE